MYSCVIVRARIKPATDYDWFTYKGPMIMIPYRGIEVPLSKGEVFGVRKSSNGKQIRLVMGDDVNRVFTITLDLAKQIAKNCRAQS